MQQPPKMTILPAFATPFAFLQYPAHERLNRELKALFLEHERVGGPYKNPIPTPTTQVNIFESDFTLFSWKDEPIQELFRFAMQSLVGLIAQLNGYDQETLGKLKIHNHAWYHITRFGGYISGHVHPMASWSGVYCVAAGERPAEWPDSGVLRFSDPRASAFMYQDAGNDRIREPFNRGSQNFRLESGHLVLFPSYLMHEVTPFFGKDERITVAFNAWVR